MPEVFADEQPDAAESLGLERLESMAGGKVLSPQNYWTNVRYEQGTNNRLAYLNILDYVANGVQYVYSVEYAPTAIESNEGSIPSTFSALIGNPTGTPPCPNRPIAPAVA